MKQRIYKNNMQIIKWKWNNYRKMKPNKENQNIDTLIIGMKN